jgi:hypothetical protein
LYRFDHRGARPTRVHVVLSDGCAFILAEDLTSGCFVLLDFALPGQILEGLELVPSVPELCREGGYDAVDL